VHKLALIVIAAGVAALLAQPSPSYRVTHTYLLGGDGSWDYVVPDPPNHRLFIARQTRVMVVDEDNGTLLGEVTGIQGAHGTAVAASTGHGFATSGNDQSVVMFDLKTYQVLGRIAAAEDADAIVYDSVSNRVFTLNGDAHSSTVIDPRDGKVITNLALGGKPEYGVSAGDGKVYANIGGDRREDRDPGAALGHRRVQGARLHGDRYRSPSLVQRVPQRSDGSLGLSGRQGGGHHPDRDGCRRRRIRSGLGQRIRLQCRRHAHGDS
jgi:hypothetical protein